MIITSQSPVARLQSISKIKPIINHWNNPLHAYTYTSVVLNTQRKNNMYNNTYEHNINNKTEEKNQL